MVRLRSRTGASYYVAYRKRLNSDVMGLGCKPMRATVSNLLVFTSFQSLDSSFLCPSRKRQSKVNRWLFGARRRLDEFLAGKCFREPAQHLGQICFSAWSTFSSRLLIVIITQQSQDGLRSEERRVGKEWRHRWWP